jgi:succinate dehydrogenase / fumarate reductase cytochrome b subunit
MIISGLVVLAFLGLHFYDFWFPEMDYKYITQMPLDETRYFEELVHKFHSPVRTGLYCLSFVLLSLHLWHGFTSSFQSVGARRVSVGAENFGKAFATIIPFGFVFIALYHHFMG